MKTLAIDFSSSRRGLALLEREPDGAARIAACAEETGAGGLQALELVDRVLHIAQWKREEIECLALGLGPGSYTGIRASIALAQGWQLARNVHTIGISSMEVLARTAQNQGCRDRVAILVDAQRQEFYLSEYDLSCHPPRWAPSSNLESAVSQGNANLPADQIHPHGSICLVSLEQARQVENSGTRLAGPDLAPVFSETLPVYPDPRQLGIMALGRTDFVPANELTPIYLRPISFVKAPPPRFPET